MKKTVILFITLLIHLIHFSQTTIYSEDFSGQNNKGARGTTIDVTDVSWNVDVSAATLSNTDDWLRVRIPNNGNEFLEARDVDGNAIWLSPTIDITNFINVQFSLDVSRNNNLENVDTVTIQYRIDGGNWTNASTNGSLSGNYSNPTVSSNTGLSGSTIELRVVFFNDEGNDRQRIDNILIEGTLNCSTFSLPFTESFEGATFPPACWDSYRGTNGLGTAEDWQSTTLVANTGVASALIFFEVVTGGNSEDWLVTPAIDLGSNQTQLRFFVLDGTAEDFGSEFSVRISQTSQTDISSFTTLRTYTEPELGNTFNEKTIDLSEYSGIVYLSFVVEQNDGDNIALDDISITDLSSCTTPEDITDLSVTLDENGGIELNWDLSTCYDEVLIIARENSVVTTTPTGDGSGITANSNFGSGTEIVADEFAVFKGINDQATITNLNLGNTYHFEVFTRKGTQWSAGVPISILFDYCTSIGDTSFGTAITLVNIGSINNVTGTGTGYDDFTSQVTDIARGASEDLIVNIDTAGTFNVYSYAWVDWNQDGDFDDANEAYDLGNAFDNGNIPTDNSPLTITAPTDAVLGNTRLRILCQFYFTTIPTNGPCDGSTDGEIEDYTINITPETTYIYDNGWSPSDPNGVSNLADTIIVQTGGTSINTDTDCNTLTINPGAGLTIDSGTTLQVANILSLESTSISYSSLILNGSITGNIEYKRHVNAAAGSGNSTTNNDLISAPLIGQSFGDFRANNSNILSGNIGGNLAFLFGPFNTSANNYVLFDTTNDTEALTAGLGYRTGSTDNSTYTFTGTVENSVVNAPVISSGSNNWNLIGNPYPSYLKIQDFLSNTNNANLLDENAVGIYGYDGAALDGWTILNLANTTPSTTITPGQGFFVQAESAGSITFDPSWQTTGNSDDFILGRSTNELTYLKLNLNLGNNNYRTDFYFNTNSTLGLDIGYDAIVWNGTPEPFSLYSNMIEGNTTIPLALQSLDLNTLQNITIPLGVNTTSTGTLQFNISESNLPTGTDVYILDMVNQSSTLITDSTYSIDINSIQNGTGRFYLRFVNTTLSLTENDLDTINIFVEPASNQIIIQGQLNENTKARVYDLQGRLITSKKLYTNTLTNIINISDWEVGVYIVILNDNISERTQKIILR